MPMPTAMSARAGKPSARASGKPRPKGFRMSSARASGAKTRPAELMLKGPQLSAAVLSTVDKILRPSTVLRTPRLCVKVRGLFTSDPAKVKRRFSSMKDRMPRSSKVWSNVESRKPSVCWKLPRLPIGEYVVTFSRREKFLFLIVPEVKPKITNAAIASTNAGAPNAPTSTQFKKSTCSTVASVKAAPPKNKEAINKVKGVEGFVTKFSAVVSNLFFSANFSKPNCSTVWMPRPALSAADKSFWPSAKESSFFCSKT
mmetsp:Transcript_22809/g.73706  ORF Transcript_22809/g.73706 Transcript_22809/m.73706 type:complete len:257 (+) Transcript_22809:330-1100(+)